MSKEELALAKLTASLDECLRVTLDACESPVERLLMLAIISHYAFTLEVPNNAINGGRFGDFSGDSVRPQYRVECSGHVYRLDFAVPSQRLAIEVDGHDFHERTKAQASRDKARDRALTAAGWRVLRFTGSDVWNDAASCAQEIFSVLAGLERVGS